MVLSESTPHAHLYLVLGAVILLSIFIVFVYIAKKREGIDDYSDENREWLTTFRKSGFTDAEISRVTHDDHVWYYDGKNTCVGYGDAEDECPAYQTYCAGGSVNGTYHTYGTLQQQSLAILKSIKSGGVHEECPLIYSDD